MMPQALGGDGPLCTLQPWLLTTWRRRKRRRRRRRGERRRRKQMVTGIQSPSLGGLGSVSTFINGKWTAYI